MAPSFVIPPDGALPLKVLFERVVPEDCRLDSLRVDLDRARAQFVCRRPEATAELVLMHRSAAAAECAVGESAAVCFNGAPQLAGRFRAATERAAQAAGPEIFREIPSAKPTASTQPNSHLPSTDPSSLQAPKEHSTAWAFNPALVWGLLVLLGLGLLLARRRLAAVLCVRSEAAQVRVLSALLLVTYVFSANGVLNLYPLSTFDMYSDRAAPSVERILVKRADGSVTQPQRYMAWHCTRPIDPLSATPFGVHTNGIPYMTENVARHMADNWVNDARAHEPVSIIDRTYTLRDSGPPKVEDRKLLACQAGGFE